MKRLIFLFTLIFLVSGKGESARIITSFDIARWYLDSDLVVICSVNKIDTLEISSYDSVYTNNKRLRYDVIRELYHITVDSTLRILERKNESIESILSQRFSINYSHTKILENRFDHIDSKGDSIFIGTMESYMDDYSDNSYFRIGLGKKYIVILSKTSQGYVIDYESECTDSNIDMITEIEIKGESYLILQPEE